MKPLKQILNKASHAAPQFVCASFLDGRRVYIAPHDIARFFDGSVNGTDAPCCVVVLTDGRSLALRETADDIMKQILLINKHK